jgi:peptide/nickel transport system permease protein
LGRAAYIRKRLVLMIFVLFGVTLIIFSMIHLVPGDPAFLILGERATDQKAADLRPRSVVAAPVLAFHLRHLPRQLRHVAPL